jgi:putative acetyltransferase
MIRRATAMDSEAITDLWLHASILAHRFLPRDFWVSRAEDMRSVYLPNSETWVKIQENTVKGFASLVDDHLAALFVHPSAQDRGLGRELLDFAQEKRQSLFLSVYSENYRAVCFYRRNGFHVVEERQDAHSGHLEFVMAWSSVDA